MKSPGSLLAALLTATLGAAFLAAGGCAEVRTFARDHVRHAEAVDAYEREIPVPCYALLSADVIVTADAPAHCPPRDEMESVARLVQRREGIRSAVLVFVPTAIDCDGDVVDGCVDLDVRYAYVQAHFGWARIARHELTHLALGSADPDHAHGVWAVVDGPPPFEDEDYGGH